VAPTGPDANSDHDPPAPDASKQGKDAGLPQHVTPQATPSSAPHGNPVDHVETLLDTDDQTLEELLAELDSDEQWLEEVAAEVTRSKNEENRRVTALLDEIGKKPLDEPRKAAPSTGDDDSDDNSEGDVMAREADHVLAQAVDEAEWEKANLPQEERKAITPPETSETKKSARDEAADPFNLPAVPSELQDQPGLPETSQEDTDFAAGIAARMAALKGLGDADRSLPSAPTSNVDDLGLPRAPTFAPEDRPVQCIYKRHGFNNEDTKTWCTVCLEDATVRCIGCDDDVYCARCWKEMHVGPAAGYDERGHRREKFIRPR
jgi:hypothetical protein